MMKTRRSGAGAAAAGIPRAHDRTARAVARIGGAADSGHALLWAALAALLLGGVACREGGSADEVRPASDTAPLLARQVLVLEKEQALASGDKAYFVLDLGRKRLDLRMNGLTLRTWDGAIRCWGLAPGAQDYTLVRKSALNPPQRRLLRPEPVSEAGEDDNPGPDTEASSAEPEALELDDMPALFNLSFDGDLDVQVTTGERSRLGRMLDELTWHVRTPLQSLAHALRRRPFTRVRLTVTGRTEAQAIYWSLAEGIRGVIMMPEAPAK